MMPLHFVENFLIPGRIHFTVHGVLPVKSYFSEIFVDLLLTTLESSQDLSAFCNNNNDQSFIT